MRLRPYRAADKQACLSIFDSNTPVYFAPHELADYEKFLDALPSFYFVVEDDRGVIACGGYYVKNASDSAGLTWGMVRREAHHKGIGTFLLLARLEELCRNQSARFVRLDTSQHSRGFFERFGFKVVRVVENGYAPGLHRHEMELSLDIENCWKIQRQFTGLDHE